MNTRSCSTRTTCPYCGVGCGLVVNVDSDGSVNVEGDVAHPANQGRLCTKGSALAQTLGLDARLLHPRVDDVRVSWDKALSVIADGLSRTIEKYGPESVAFYVSGQLLTEDYYVANKLMKGFIGSANIDTNSRLCMASSVAGHKRAFGADTVPGTYADLELADLVILTGSNLAWCHPVLYQRLAEARAKKPGMRVVLIDPRRTATSALADMHLPVCPDGDVALFTGLLRHLLDTDALAPDYINAYVEGDEACFAQARMLDPEALPRLTGLSKEQLGEFYRLFARTAKTVTVYSQGVNQSQTGTDKVNAIINCHLATGRIGRPGMGPFSVTGQPNAMGGREVGGLANMLAAHMELGDAAARERVQRFWEAPTIAQRPGLKAVDLFEAVADGRVKAVWIMGTNPVDSMPDAARVATALANCPLVVASDVVADNDTLAYAHVKLPAAAWGEKDGTVTNSERRVSRQRAFLPLPGEVKPDWWIVCEVAKRLGFGHAFDFESSAEIFSEHAALSGFENEGGRDFDISGYENLSRAEFDALTPFQWPAHTRNRSTKDVRFFGAGGYFHADGRARMLPVSAAGLKAKEPETAFVLNTGRIRDHWHTMTRTGESSALWSHLAEPFAEINPTDAAALGIEPASLVRMSNSRGRIIVRALITSRVSAGHVFVPMHWTDIYTPHGRVGQLIEPKTDPVSGQPALKHARVNLCAEAMGGYGFALSQAKPTTTLADYWALARCSGGWRAELAWRASTVPDPTLQLRTIYESREGDEIVEYTDHKSGRGAAAAFRKGSLVALIFTDIRPVAASRSWVSAHLDSRIEDLSQRIALLAGKPADSRADAGAIVCACYSVGERQIKQAAADGVAASVEDIGKLLKAGTNCGSCRSEINLLLASNG